MSNGLDIAADLAGVGQVKVRVTGGKLCSQLLSFLGAQAEASLDTYTFDKLFLGFDGLDLQQGLTSFDEQVAGLSQAFPSSNPSVSCADDQDEEPNTVHIISSHPSSPRQPWTSRQPLSSPVSTAAA